MSNFITTAFQQQFSTNVGMLLQQKESRLRAAVMVQPITGAKTASLLDQFGEATAVKNTVRHGDTPIIGVPQDRRWVSPVDYDWGDLIDNQDRLRTAIEPTSPIALAGAMALNRACDDEILLGIFNQNQTGETGTTPVSALASFNSGSQIVAHGGTALSVAKLRAARKMLMRAEVDLDAEPVFLAITADDQDALLSETQVTSLDYNTRPVLVDGKLTSFMGFNFIHSERVPGGAKSVSGLPTPSTAVAGASRLLPFWVKSGVALGMWNDINTQIAPRPDKRFATQIYVTGTFGGSRLEEKKTGIIAVA